MRLQTARVRSARHLAPTATEASTKPNSGRPPISPRALRGRAVAKASLGDATRATT